MRPFPRRAPSAAAAGPLRKSGRGWRRAGIAAVIVLALILVSTIVNLVLESTEKSGMAAYGERISIGGGSLNVHRTGQETGPPLVLLSGLGTVAPGLDFAPLARELSGHDVLVVEGYGYGYSDMDAGPRTNGNISTELHEVLTKLQVKQPYVLAGHSIAGFYMLDYANRFPAEVSAIVGIDATVPTPGSGPAPDPEPGFNWQRVLSVTGIVRAVTAIAPDFVDPASDAYTAEELERMRLMTSWNYGNPAVADETARIPNNAAALRGVTYPDNLPVLAFVADDTDSIASKTATVQDLLSNVRRHRIVTLEGHHYLHWTESKRMAQEIQAFLAGSG